MLLFINFMNRRKRQPTLIDTTVVTCSSFTSYWVSTISAVLFICTSPI